MYLESSKRKKSQNLRLTDPKRIDSSGPGEPVLLQDSGSDTELRVQPFIIDIAFGQEKHRIVMNPGENAE